MNFNGSNMINLLIYKIFHDIGNSSALLNFFVGFNRDKPNNIDFSELIEINHRSLVVLSVLKYAFLPGEQDEKTFDNLKDYFAARKIDLKFEIDEFLFSEDCLTITVHTLMLLSKIAYSGAKVTAKHFDNNISFKCSSAKKDIERLKAAIFNNLDAQDNINMFFFNITQKMNLNLSCKFLNNYKIVVEFTPETK